MVDYGTDFDSSWSVTSQGDLKILRGMDNAKQAILNRLLTPYKELDEFYNEYGCRSHEELGNGNDEHSKQRLELYIRETLKQEPRVAELEKIEIIFQDQTAFIELSILLSDEETVENLVYTIGDIK